MYFNLKGQEVDFQDLQKEVATIQSQPQKVIESNVDLNPKKAHMLSKSNTGLLYALFQRQLATRIEPDPNMINDYHTFVDK